MPSVIVPLACTIIKKNSTKISTKMSELNNFYDFFNSRNRKIFGLKFGNISSKNKLGCCLKVNFLSTEMHL